MAKLTKSQILGNLADKTGVSKKAAGDVRGRVGKVGVQGSEEFVHDTRPRENRTGKSQSPSRSQPGHGRDDSDSAKRVVKFRIAKAAKDAILGTK